SAAIGQYGRQTFETHGPEHNVQLDAIAWATAELRAAGIRVVVLAFPENPVLEDPEARALYDTRLSDAVAHRLDADATARGARFVDLRHVLDAEDFYDLIHPNVSGSRKLSERLGAIIAEEWKAAGRCSSTPGPSPSSGPARSRSPGPRRRARAARCCPRSASSSTPPTTRRT